MEPLHLFRNLAVATGENALTEALAATLKTSIIFRQKFLSWVKINVADLVIETQPRYPQGRPDLHISSATHLLLFEIKNEAPLTYDQWRRYRDILDTQPLMPYQHLVCIVAPWTHVDEEILALRPSPDIWQWSEVYQMARKASHDESDPIALFLIHELMDFIEGLGMKPFDKFSPCEISMLKQLYQMKAKIAALFTDVIHELSKSYRGSFDISSKGYEVGTNKGNPELYPGLTFEITSQGHKVDAWIGCECSAHGPVSLVYLWRHEKEKGPPRPEALEQVLAAEGFAWDKYAYCHYKQLATDIAVSSDDVCLVQSFAQEVAGILNRVFSHFDSLR
jgi:hypothetical protein